MTKCPHLLSQVYIQVSEHENYYALPDIVFRSLNRHFGPDTVLFKIDSDSPLVNHVLKQMIEIDNSPSHKKYMNKMLRNTWKHLFQGEPLDQY